MLPSTNPSLNGYSVLLNASDQTGSFFLPVQVIAGSESHAVDLVRRESQVLGLLEFEVDEVELIEAGLTQVSPGIVEVLGRSYYREG